MRSWLIALRIARREARRAKGRTLLVVAMIAVPVMALAFAAAVYDMSELTQAEAQQRTLGAGNALVNWVPPDSGTSPDSGGQNAADRPPTTAEVAAALPPGTQLTRYSSNSVAMRTTHGVGDVDVYFFDYGRLTAPLVRLVSGDAPSKADEVAVSPTARKRLGTRVGATITVPPDQTGTGMFPAGTYRVVGIAEIGGHIKDCMWFSSSESGDTASWIAHTPVRLDKAAANALSAKNLKVFTMADLAPPVSATTRGFTLFGIGTIIAGLGILEVVLLAGPAFAVGARRRQRDLALTAANGASAAMVQRIVLADGVFAGGVAGLGGILIGATAAFASRGLIAEHLTHERPGGYRVYPTALAIIVAVAVVTGLLGALIPAVAVGRQDVVAALSGRRGVTRSRRRWLVVGIVGAAAGAAVAVFGADRSSANIVLTGLIIGELGLVLCTPTIVGGIARLGRFLPVPTRIALRDTARRRSAAAPAISAVMAAVAGSVALTVYLSANDARANQTVQPMPTGTITVYTTNEKNAAEQTRAILSRQFPSATIGTILGPDCDCLVQIEAGLPESARCPFNSNDPLTAAQQAQAKADARCDDPWQRYLVMTAGDTPTAAAIMRQHDPAMINRINSTLSAGGALVGDPRLIGPDGRVVLQVSTERSDGTFEVPTSVKVPAIAVATGGLDTVVLGPDALRELGITKTAVQSVLAFPTHAVTADQQERLDGALFDAGLSRSSLEAEPAADRHPIAIILTVAAALIALGAAAMSTGLAAADGRADLSTLAAVGASPGVRRQLSLSQSGVIALLGSALGVVAGLGAAAAVLTGLNQVFNATWPAPPSYPIRVPWVNLLIALVVVPAIAMLGAGLLTRSRLPSERRAD